MTRLGPARDKPTPQEEAVWFSVSSSLEERLLEEESASKTWGRANEGKAPSLVYEQGQNRSQSDHTFELMSV